MNVSSVALWGLVATLVLSTVMEGSRGLGISRMSIPFMLGVIFTDDRDRARVYGFVVHVLDGWLFAVVYALVFQSLGRASWWIGGGLGVAHGLVVLVVLMPLMPGLHPRMASEEQGPEPTRSLEPPGFMALNYGRRTPLVTLAAHLTYGIILGGFYELV